MLCFCLAKHNDIVTYVEGIWDVLELVLDCLLENFACRICSKVKSSVSPKPFVRGKGGDITAF